MVPTPKRAFFARSLAFIQKPRGIFVIAFSALFIFVVLVKIPSLPRKFFAVFAIKSMA
jgi:hypothetical protein